MCVLRDMVNYKSFPPNAHLKIQKCITLGDVRLWSGVGTT